MNSDNQSPIQSTNTSGFTPSNANFINTQNSGLNNISSEQLEDMKDRESDSLNLHIDSQLGLTIPQQTSSEDIFQFKAFFELMRNMFKWEMLSQEQISVYYRKFITLNISQRESIISQLQSLYAEKLEDNLVVDEYFDQEEAVQILEDALDELEPIAQEKLIYAFQNNQEMPKDLVEKLQNELDEEGNEDIEAEAFAKKNLEKVLSRKGFNASTLTSADISELVNNANSSARPAPIPANLPNVRVPSRQSVATQTLPVSGSLSPQNPLQDYSSPVENNEYNESLASQNFTSNVQPVQQNTQPINSNQPNNSYGQNVQPLQVPAGPKTFPKPIAGISRTPKGLDDLLNH